MKFRGTCKYFLDQYQEAIVDFESVIKFDPDNTIALSSISYINELLGNNVMQKKENFEISIILQFLEDKHNYHEII